MNTFLNCIFIFILISLIDRMQHSNNSCYFENYIKSVWCNLSKLLDRTNNCCAIESTKKDFVVRGIKLDKSKLIQCSEILIWSYILSLACHLSFVSYNISWEIESLEKKNGVICKFVWTSCTKPLFNVHNQNYKVCNPNDYFFH